MENINEARWVFSLDEAARNSNITGKPALLVFYSPGCTACDVFFDETLPKKKVITRLNSSYVPAFIEVAPEGSLLYGVWDTPTFIATDFSSPPTARWSGHLPEDDFVDRLELSLAQLAFSRGEYGKAAELLDGILFASPFSHASAEVCYLLGLAKYRETKEERWLARAYDYMRQAYPGSVWTLKASVWAKKARVKAERAA